MDAKPLPGRMHACFRNAITTATTGQQCEILSIKLLISWHPDPTMLYQELHFYDGRGGAAKPSKTMKCLGFKEPSCSNCTQLQKWLQIIYQSKLQNGETEDRSALVVRRRRYATKGYTKAHLEDLPKHKQRNSDTFSSNYFRARSYTESYM